MAKKIQSEEKVHVWTWMITAGLLTGIYVLLTVIMEIYEINTIFFSQKFFSLLKSMYPGLTINVQGAFVGFAYGLLDGAICGGSFAYIHNIVRKFFK